MADLSRLKALERNHILDEATRLRRQKKAIDALEKDNFQDNLQSSTIYVSDYRLQLNRRLQQRFNVADEKNDSSTSAAVITESSTTSNNKAEQDRQQQQSNGSSSSSGQASTSVAACAADQDMSRRKKARTETRLLKFARKTFANLAEEEHAWSSDKKFNYFSITVPGSKYPPRKFCAVCGFSSAYNCIQCGSKYCSSKCLQTHKDTRCLKWTA